MKYIVLVPDGMADYPIEELDNRTPLEAAKTPNMDFLAQNGQIGLVKTIPDNFIPASDVANLSILGYDPLKYYTGRGPLEAANLGINLADDEVAFRCNFITYENDKLIDYSAGHIKIEESQILIKFLNEKLGSNTIKFYPGISYRNLMVVKSPDYLEISKIACLPPHDIIGQDIKRNLPKAKSAKFLIDLMLASQELLKKHEINQVRVDLGENPANMIWLWGQGRKPQMPSFKEKFGLTGSVISAVDLIKGLGKILGLSVINVPGATGYYDTNYLGKAEAAINSLKTKEFVFVHVEATDEAGHNADLRAKLTAIEKFDQLIVGTILNHFKGQEDMRILLLPDHATPISKRTHTNDPVCFAIYGKNISKGDFSVFSEEEGKKSKIYFEKGYELLNCFINSTL